jgi:hypothetical protein
MAIVIGFAWEDSEYAHRLVEMLRAEGLDVRRDLLSSGDPSSGYLATVAAAQTLVAVFSPSDSDVRDAAIRVAQRSGIPIAAVVMDGGTVPEGMPVALRLDVSPGELPAPSFAADLSAVVNPPEVVRDEPVEAEAEAEAVPVPRPPSIPALVEGPVDPVPARSGIRLFGRRRRA